MDKIRIGVVSDTHSYELPKQMLEDFKNVDFIIHAGDACSLSDLKQIEKIKEVKAVYGNMDSDSVRANLPRTKIFQCGNFSIGVFHGEGAPSGLLDIVKSEFKNKKVDVVIFGHSHNPFNQKIGKVLYFNPGSPTDTVYAPYNSYGILEINNEIKGKIIKVKSNG